MSDVVIPPGAAPPAGPEPVAAPGAAPDAAPAAHERGGLGAWLTTTDHKRIGTLHRHGARLLPGGDLHAMLIRTQLIRPA